MFVLTIVTFVPHSTIGLSLVSEAPAHLRFELSIGCFDLVPSVVPCVNKLTAFRVRCIFSGYRGSVYAG